MSEPTAEIDQPNEQGVTPLDEAVVEDWGKGLLQTVTVIKSADRHADLHVREFAAAHEITVESGNRFTVLVPGVLCGECQGSGAEVGPKGRPQECRRCMGDGTNPGLKRGYQRILSEPQRVIDEQTAAAEGVFI